MRWPDEQDSRAHRVPGGMPSAAELSRPWAGGLDQLALLDESIRRFAFRPSGKTP